MVTDTITLRVRELETLEYIWSSKELRNSFIKVNGNGEVIKEERKYKDCIIMSRRGNDLDIVFKVHHFYNVMVLGQYHNANQLSISNAIESVKLFQSLFKLSFEQSEHLQVKTLEFGLNIVQELYNTIDLINQITFSKKQKFIEQTKDFLYKECVRGVKDMLIKVYHKTGQFPKYAKANTMRIEVKYKNSRLCRSKIGVDNLNNLTDPKVYEFMRNEFVKELEDILILQLDVKNQKVLNDSERKKLRELYINPNQWVKSSNNKNTFSRWKKSYTKILDKTGDNLHTKLLKQIILECESMLLEFKKGVDSPTIFVGGKTSINKRIKNNKNTTDTQVKRVCKVTGIDITNQKNVRAKFVGEKTLEKIKESDPVMFERLKIKYLNRTKWTSKKECYYIAHNIRNSYHNRFQYVPKPSVNQIHLF